MVFNESEVVDFIIGRIKELYPNAHFEQLEQHKYRVWFTGQSPLLDTGQAEIYFGNIIENYKKTNNINTIVDFVNTYTEILNTYTDRKADELINFDNVFPVIKLTGYGLGKNKPEVEIVSDKLNKDLKFVYGENHATFVNYLYNPLPESYTHGKVVEKAFSNLKRKGWLKEVDVNDINGIKFYRFDSDEYPYQGQFFIREWAYEHFQTGNIVYSFPTANITLAMAVPNEHLISNLGSISSFQMIFAKMTEDTYRTNPSALTTKIFTLTEGKVITLS